MKCPSCGAEALTKFCPYCGSEMPYKGPATIINNQTIINNYYGDNREDAIPHRVSGRHRSVSSKRKSTALLWCAILGMFGAHYFYVGKVGKGILYFFTCGLFGVGWIVDIIRIASGSFVDSYGLKLDPEPMPLKEKGYWFLGFMIFGVIGIVTAISESNTQMFLMYLIWTGIFGCLFYANRKKIEK